MSELLDKVKNTKGKKKYKVPNGFEEVALAWCRDEVTISQIATALDFPKGAALYSRLALTLKEYINKNNNQ